MLQFQLHLVCIFAVFTGSTLALLDFFKPPNYFRHGDKISLFVNKIESDHTQLPYAWYSLSFVCPPMHGAKPVHLSLGEILRGDRIWDSGYKLNFGMDSHCSRLCDLRATQAGIKRAAQLVKDGYVAHWSVDGLPGATTFESNLHRNKYYAAGFPLGFVDNEGVSYYYNHVMLVIRYHRDKPNDRSYIVGFEVYPKSVSDTLCPGASKSYKNFALRPQYDENGQLSSERTTIPYTYSVYWREDSSIDYDSRWDLYYANESVSASKKIHWISLVNSLVLIFLVSAVVMVVFIQIMKKDFHKLAPSFSTPNESSNLSIWNSLAHDVSKTPASPLLLTTLVSGGIQSLIAVIGVITLHSLDSIRRNSFVNNHQSALFSFSIFCFSLSGLASSFIGINIYKCLQNETEYPYSVSRAVPLALTFSAALPAFLFSLMMLLNFFVWAQEASTALPFGTIVVFVSLFILIQCPLGIVGGWMGNNYKVGSKSAISEYHELGEKTSDSTRTRTLYRYRFRVIRAIASFVKSTAVFGLIPFGIVYVELIFIFNSVWLEKTTFYYMYGFSFITTIMLMIILAESTIIAIYISLVYYNDANWQWLSFRVGSGIAWYIYGYSIYYYFKVLNIDDYISTLLYFSYMALACFIIGVAGGSVSVLTGLMFIRKIYRSVKLE
ncbi:uncharacterized protein LODBEIA_P09220 [Lodderomyces beijingensis]|uniref:Transmembrane 9 superfamily member n=1 Tax=Lodderomyces beijingensis TaxID=1775926 RepID=A0ABP0ZEX7_9ASCO